MYIAATVALPAHSSALPLAIVPVILPALEFFQLRGDLPRHCICVLLVLLPVLSRLLSFLLVLLLFPLLEQLLL